MDPNDLQIASLAAEIRRRLEIPVVLTGLMGAGKTRVGRLLAGALDLPFVDSDDEIEAAAGRRIADIFAEDGEPFFRDAERRVITRILGTPGPGIVATGGGAFAHPATAEIILEKALTLWLRADPALLAKRTAGDRKRPLLARGDPESLLRELAEKRYPLYARANLVIDSEDVAPNVTLMRVLEKLDDYLG